METSTGRQDDEEEADGEGETSAGKQGPRQEAKKSLEKPSEDDSGERAAEGEVEEQTMAEADEDEEDRSSDREQEDTDRPEVSDDDDDESALTMAMRATPCYPFPAEFSLEVEEKQQIMGIRHLAKEHPSGVNAIVICLPGVHGGVGPCRTPGQNFCENALYPSLARKLTQAYPVSFYRCSWPFMRPQMRYAVNGVIRVVMQALREATSECPDQGERRRDIGMFFLGHSLGGAVAMHAAEVVARHFGPDGKDATRVLGIPNLTVRVAGLCTLNGALDIEDYRGSNAFQSFQSARALVVAGDADQIVPPQYSLKIYESIAVRSKKLVMAAGATHDLYSAKDQILGELSEFITEELSA